MIDRKAAGLPELRRLFRTGTVAAVPDQELIERFVSRSDDVAEAAFAALVARHGPMVLKVCRSILRNRDDAQDAFQATFLVLACKARGLSDRTLVANWLYGVALRTALKARARESRRRYHERRAAEACGALAEPTEESRTLQRARHEEIGALPEKYRAAVVLCCLKGASREAAAAELQCAVSTVSVRLMRARERLRTRLARRGLFVPAGLLALAWDSTHASAAVPSALAEATVRSAVLVTANGAGTVGVVSTRVAGLIREVRRSMMLKSLKSVAACLVSSCILLAGLAAVGRAGGGEPPRNVAQDEQRILELEHAWANALLRCDASALDRIVAYEMVGTDPAGHLWDKIEYLQAVARGDYHIRSIELAELKVRVFGDAVVATGVSIINRNAPPDAARGSARYTDMYVRRGGYWQCVAWQSLGIPGEPDRRADPSPLPQSNPAPTTGTPKVLPGDPTATTSQTDGALPELTDAPKNLPVLSPVAPRQ